MTVTKSQPETITPTDHQADYRLLISLAHPDDESFGMGGAIAMYVERGVDVSLICSTNGDVGTVAPEFMEGFDSIGELRLYELRCAAETLGMSEVITYGYRDSGMVGSADNEHPDALVQADQDVVVGRIVHDIRRIRPQVVVTFDVYGGYGHPDHIYMHHATTKAFHRAGDPDAYPEHFEDGLAPWQPDKLYYSSFPKGPLRMRVLQIRLRGEDPRHIGKNKDIDLVAALERAPETHTRLNVARYRQAWDDAANCHASQLNPNQKPSLLDRLARVLYRHKEFTRAYPEPNGHDRIERDLFEGIAPGG